MRVRIFLLLILVLLLITVAAFSPPVPQSLAYHQFADQRVILGIPNFLNIVSNLPFLFIGVAGFAFLYKEKRQSLEDDNNPLSISYHPYLIVFSGIALVFPGSAYYHWIPGNSSLFWDRLPIAVSIMALLAAVWVERIPISVKRVDVVLGMLILSGMASVIYWDWSEQQGNGNLNFYIATQFGALLLIALLVAFFTSRYTRAADIYGVLGWYILAKLAEILDTFIYSLGEIISGHTLKHLLAGMAAYWLLRMLKRRKLCYGD